MRVVIATNDKKNLNGHFALSKTFMFYDVHKDSCSLLSEMDFTPEDNCDYLNCAPRKPFRLEERLDAIRGNDMLLVSAIGGPIVDRVLQANVYPMELNAPESIDTVLEKLQIILKGEPPTWLKNVLRHCGRES